jgi:hypothetical protein
MKAKILGLVAVGLLTGPMSSDAGVITYDFSTTVGSGHFSYDDSNTTTVPATPGFAPGGVWYAALSFVFGAVSVSNPVIGNYDNYSGAVDCLTVGPSSVNYPSLSLCGSNGLWSGTQLSNLNGRGTADFVGNAIVINAAGQSGQFLSLAQRSVPEPGTLALLGLGLVGLGITRRRKAD